MREPRTERSIVDGAANLPRPDSHLLGLVHAPIDKEVRRAFDDRSTDAKVGAISPGVVHQSVALVTEIAVPHLARRYAQPAIAALAFEDTYDIADPVDAVPAFLALPFHMHPAQPHRHGLRWQ